MRRHVRCPVLNAAVRRHHAPAILDLSSNPSFSVDTSAAPRTDPQCISNVRRHVRCLVYIAAVATMHRPYSISPRIPRSLTIRAQLRTHVLVCGHVRRPVSLTAVRRHLALPTHDTRVRSLLAPWQAADTSQLHAKALVFGHM